MAPHRITRSMSMSRNGTLSPLSSCENTLLNESSKDLTCGNTTQSENGSARKIQKRYVLPHHLDKYDHENTLAADFSAAFNEDDSTTLENSNISVRNVSKAVKPLPHQLGKYQHENTLAADFSAAFQSGNCSASSDASIRSQKKKTLPHQFDRYKHDNTLAADFSSAFACETSTSSVDGPSIKKQKVLPHMQPKYQHDDTLMADFSAAFPRTNHTSSLLSINHSSSTINSSIQRSRRYSERFSFLKSNVTGSEFSLDVVIEQSPNTTYSDGNSTLAAEPDLDALIIEEEENNSIQPPKDSFVNILIPDQTIADSKLSVSNISTQTLRNEDSLSVAENADVSVVLPNEGDELRRSTAIFDVPTERSVLDVHLLGLNTTEVVRTSIDQVSNIDYTASPLLHFENAITEKEVSIPVPPVEDETSILNKVADQETSLQPEVQSGCELDLLGVNVTPPLEQPGNVDDHCQTIQCVESTLLNDQEMDTTLVPPDVVVAETEASTSADLVQNDLCPVSCQNNLTYTMCKNNSNHTICQNDATYTLGKNNLTYTINRENNTTLLSPNIIEAEKSSREESTKNHSNSSLLPSATVHQNELTFQVQVHGSVSNEKESNVGEMDQSNRHDTNKMDSSLSGHQSENTSQVENDVSLSNLGEMEQSNRHDTNKIDSSVSVHQSENTSHVETDVSVANEEESNLGETEQSTQHDTNRTDSPSVHQSENTSQVGDDISVPNEEESSLADMEQSTQHDTNTTESLSVHQSENNSQVGDDTSVPSKEESYLEEMEQSKRHDTNENDSLFVHQSKNTSQVEDNVSVTDAEKSSHDDIKKNHSDSSLLPSPPPAVSATVHQNEDSSQVRDNVSVPTEKESYPAVMEQSSPHHTNKTDSLVAPPNENTSQIVEDISVPNEVVSHPAEMKPSSQHDNNKNDTLPVHQSENISQIENDVSVANYEESQHMETEQCSRQDTNENESISLSPSLISSIRQTEVSSKVSDDDVRPEEDSEKESERDFSARCSVGEENTPTLNATPAARVSSVNMSSSTTQFSRDIAKNMFQDDDDDDEDDVFKMPEIPRVKRNARKRSGKLLDFGNDYEEPLPKRPTFPKYANYMGKEFYKLLIEKMTPKYGVKTNEKVVKVAKYISDTVCEVIWEPDREKYLPKIKELKLTLARKKVVQTHLDFYVFCIKKLPDYFYKKAVPMIVPTGTVPRHDPADEKTIFEDIRPEEDD